MSTGKPLKIIEKSVCEEAKKYFPGAEEEYYADYFFNSQKRILDRQYPEYKL
jgi:hypothetical protein